MRTEGEGAEDYDNERSSVILLAISYDNERAFRRYRAITIAIAAAMPRAATGFTQRERRGREALKEAA